ncbi:MAG: DUF1491 family protein [Alphaproteobacteria bacterium]|nr:DUF1491 family protein [Alphaproteobacteria bacterium]
MDDRIPTDLWVSAHQRDCTVKNIPFYVIHKGAPAAGTVLVKIVVPGDNPAESRGCILLNQMRDIDGNLGWMDVFDGETVDEPRADQYIQRSIGRDPDVWVIEVEDKDGKNPFEGKIF